MIVLDASVIVKWFVPEVGDAAAKASLAAADALIAPELVRVEVASALVRKGLRQELAVGDAQRALGAWLRLLSDGQIVLLPNADDIEAAAKLALEVGDPRLQREFEETNSAYPEPRHRAAGPAPKKREALP